MKTLGCAHGKVTVRVLSAFQEAFSAATNASWYRGRPTLVCKVFTDFPTDSHCCTLQGDGLPIPEQYIWLRDLHVMFVLCGVLNPRYAKSTSFLKGKKKKVTTCRLPQCWVSDKPSSKYAYTCPYVFLTQVSKITLGIPVNADLHDNIPVRFVS